MENVIYDISDANPSINKDGSITMYRNIYEKILDRIGVLYGNNMSSRLDSMVRSVFPNIISYDNDTQRQVISTAIMWFTFYSKSICDHVDVSEVIRGLTDSGVSLDEWSELVINYTFPTLVKNVSKCEVFDKLTIPGGQNDFENKKAE